MSKIVKGIKKIGKKIIGGVKKVFKAITKSTLGKILLFAAVVYLGGAAFGAWESPFTSLNGAFVSEAVAPLTAAETASMAAGEAALAPGIEAAAGAADLLTAEAGAAGLGSGVSAIEGGVVSGAGSGAGSGFSLSNVMKGAKDVGSTVAGVAKDHPLATAMLVGGLSQSAAAASARKEEEKERERMRRNLSVGELDLGLSPGGRRASNIYSSPGATRAGNPGGFINNQIRG